MAFRGNSYYRAPTSVMRSSRYAGGPDPYMAQTFQNIASMFKPLTPGDIAEGQRAQLYAQQAAGLQAQNQRTADIAAHAADPNYSQQQLDREAVAAGVYKPDQGYYAVDQGNQTKRYVADTDARAKILAESLHPVQQGAVTGGLDPTNAARMGLSQIAPVVGQQAPLNESQWKAQQGQRLVDNGALGDNALSAAIFGQKPIGAIGPDGKTTIYVSPNTAIQQGLGVPAPQPKPGVAGTPSGIDLSKLPPITRGPDGSVDEASRQAFLAALPPQTAALVQAVGSGNMNLTGVTSLRGGERQALASIVAQAYPGFDQNQFGVRGAAEKGFATGKQGDMVTAANTALGHIGDYSDLVGQLGNGAFVPLNKVSNALASIDSSSPTAINLARMQAIRSTMADELTKFYRGSGGSQADVDRELNKLDTATSPQQAQAVLAEMSNLLGSKVNAMAAQKAGALGQQTPDQLLTPAAIANLQVVQARATGQEPDAATLQAAQQGRSPIPLVPGGAPTQAPAPAGALPLGAFAPASPAGAPAGATAPAQSGGAAPASGDPLMGAIFGGSQMAPAPQQAAPQPAPAPQGGNGVPPLALGNVGAVGGGALGGASQPPQAPTPQAAPAPQPAPQAPISVPPSAPANAAMPAQGAIQLPGQAPVPVAAPGADTIQPQPAAPGAPAPGRFKFNPKTGQIE